MAEKHNSFVNIELKQRYLNFLNGLQGKKVDIVLCEKIKVQGKFEGIQRNGEHFLIQHLSTPTGVLDSGVVRTKDTVAVSFDLKNLE